MRVRALAAQARCADVADLAGPHGMAGFALHAGGRFAGEPAQRHPAGAGDGLDAGPSGARRSVAGKGRVKRHQNQLMCASENLEPSRPAQGVPDWTG